MTTPITITPAQLAAFLQECETVYDKRVHDLISVTAEQLKVHMSDPKATALGSAVLMVDKHLEIRQRYPLPKLEGAPVKHPLGEVVPCQNCGSLRFEKATCNGCGASPAKHPDTERLAESAKRAASDLLLAALSGTDKSLRTEDGFIRWGLVERKIHDAIDAARKQGGAS